MVSEGQLADACSRPGSQRDQPASRPRGLTLTPCMPCSFGVLPHPRSEPLSPAHRASRSDRECPLDTAGDRCLWHAGGTADENDDAPHLTVTAPSWPRG